jgi:uncharacterized protein YcfL
MKNRWNSLPWWMGIVTAALLTGCTVAGLQTRQTAALGAGGYCLHERTLDSFKALLVDSNVTYGPYKRGKVAGNSSLCGLAYFHVYTVSWETKDGRKERYEFDLEKLMRKLQDERPVVLTLTKHASQPDLLVEYKPGEINISYKVFQYQVDGMEERNGRQVLVKPTVDTQFPLLTVPLNSQATTPAIK